MAININENVVHCIGASISALFLCMLKYFNILFSEIKTVINSIERHVDGTDTFSLASIIYAYRLVVHIACDIVVHISLWHSLRG